MTCRESKTAPRRSGIPIVEERSISVTARGGQVFVYCLAYDGLDTVDDVDTAFSLFDATAVEVEDHGATAASVHAVHGVGGFNHLEVLDFPSGGAFRRAGVLEAELHLLARVGLRSTCQLRRSSNPYRRATASGRWLAIRPFASRM